MVRTIETDVLVIGGGGAAARAAIEAHKAGAKTTIAVKGRFGFRGLRGTGATSYSSAGYLYFFLPGKEVKQDEECEVIYQRIIQAGLGLADKKLARILVEEGMKTRKSLDEWGVVHSPAQFPVISPERIARRIDPMPGLANVIRGTTNVTVMEQVMVTDLLIRDGVCVGAVALSEEDGEMFVIQAGSTILATGGSAQLFKVNLHPSCVTGDGYAMGYEAGAELMHMEFMQIYAVTVYPTHNLLSSAVWMTSPGIVNENGEEFVKEYLPEGVTIEKCMEDHSKHGPFSTRDMGKYLEIAISKEIKTRSTESQSDCYIEVSPLNRIPPIFQEWFRYRGVDFTRKYIEITISQQCSNGGLVIDENGETTIPGLYAAGEAATGPHGADRLGGGMQALSQVFGMRAGKHAASMATKRRHMSVDDKLAKSQLERISKLKESKGEVKLFEALKMLKQTAWESLIAGRSKEGLVRSLEEIGRISNELVPRLSVENTQELVLALELVNLLKVGEIVTRSALARRESRGGHYRDDFPERDDRYWLKAIIVKKVAGEIQLDTRTLDREWEDRPALMEGWWG